MKILQLIIICVFPFISISQWSKTYGGHDFENGYSAKQTSDGGYVLLGTTFSYGSENGNIWLLKTDSNGDTLWTKTIGDTTKGYAVIQTSDGGYALTGTQGPFSSYKSMLIKTNNQGDILWTKLYGDLKQFRAIGLEQTDDGGFILSGYYFSGVTNIYSNQDIYLIKTDSLGNTLWSKTYGGSGLDSGTAKKTSDGGYIISGQTTSFGNAVQLWLIRTDDIGDTLWTRVIGDTGNEQGRAIETSDNGFIIVGKKTEFSIGSPADVWIVKTDFAGNILWTKTYGGNEHDAATSVEETPDNGFIIGARTQSHGNGETDYWLLRTDNLGDTLWTRTFGGELNEYPGECHQTTDGGYIFMGYSESFGNGNHDLWLIKLDADGLLQKSEINKSLFSIYPNPVDEKLYIKSENSFENAESIVIYDLNGRIIKSYEKFYDELDVTDLLSGVYVLTFITKNSDHSFKFVKQ